MTSKIQGDRVDLMTKEIELTKLLASNDPKTRSEGIKKIKELLLKHSGDTSECSLFFIFVSYILNNNYIYSLYLYKYSANLHCLFINLQET